MFTLKHTTPILNQNLSSASSQQTRESEGTSGGREKGTFAAVVDASEAFSGQRKTAVDQGPSVNSTASKPRAPVQRRTVVEASLRHLCNTEPSSTASQLPAARTCFSPIYPFVLHQDSDKVRAVHHRHAHQRPEQGMKLVGDPIRQLRSSSLGLLGLGDGAAARGQRAGMAR